MDRHAVNTLEDAEVHIKSLWVNVEDLQKRVRYLEKLEDIWNTPWWKIVLFVIDGWPLRRVVRQPQWRPWRRWWTS